MLAPEVVESAEKRVGETICGKWHLDRVIGIGGMAAVYEATHRNRNRVAIKLLHPALSLDEGTRHRFLREGYVANTIRHSGAVQVLDDDVTEQGIAFLVMELLRGESVEERMMRKGGSLDIRESLEMADQLLDVLGAAHDQKVVHRDIKPDNIFLTDSGELKVLDFGIARLHQGDSRKTKVGSFMGTPAFCSQEQARGRWDEVDLRTDIFSVGATLFTCLTGTHVHEAETSSEQLALAISASARSLAVALPGASADLVDLVDTSLAYHKEERFQSTRAMRAAVQRVAAGIPPASSTSVAPPVGATFGASDLEPDILPGSHFPGPSGTMRALLGVLAAGVLAVLLFVAARATESSPGPRALERKDSPPASALQSAQKAPSQILEGSVGKGGESEIPFANQPDEPGAPLHKDEKSSGVKQTSPRARAARTPQGSSKLPAARRRVARKVRTISAPPPPLPAPLPDPSQILPSSPSPSSSSKSTDEEGMYGSRY